MKYQQAKKTISFNRFNLGQISSLITLFLLNFEITDE
tara:strand:+ start:882 stop:992 length:111 start_codon:yes stop_codon:yes gene_type:complete